MTPSQFEDRARQRYNAVNDTFWSSAEILGYLTDACTAAASEGLLIEGLDTSITTVNGTQSYAFPTNVVAIKRMTWNDIRVDPIDMIEDDAVTPFTTGVTDTGNPLYYWIWNSRIYLRPIPASAQTLKLWVYKTPSDITASSTLEVPTELQPELFNYVLREMTAKDKNYGAADRYDKAWEKSLLKIRSWARRRKRADGFTVVKSEEIISRGI